MVISPKKYIYETACCETLKELHNIYHRFWKKKGYKPFGTAYPIIQIKNKVAKSHYYQAMIKPNY